MADPRLAAVLATARDPAIAEQARGSELARRVAILERKSQFAAVVTQLPSAPFNGQEIFYEADAAKGIYWHLKYVASQPVGKRWVKAGDGGMSLTADVATDSAINTAAYSSYGGPSVVVPLFGDYELSYGMNSYFTNTANATGSCQAAPQVGGAGAVDADMIQWAPGFLVPAGVAAASSPARSIRKTDVPAGATIELMFKFVNNGCQARWRWLRVSPIRVG